MEYPFKYAAHKDIIAKQLPNYSPFTKEKTEIRYNTILISELPGDCGCLLIRDLWGLTPKTLKDIENFASLNGYSKIICSFSETYSTYEHLKNILKRENFNIIDTGFSNRSYYGNNHKPAYNLKTCFCIKIIDPIQKGYV